MNDMEKMKDKRKDIDVEIVKRQVQKKQEENYYVTITYILKFNISICILWVNNNILFYLKVINSILHQYRGLYFKNNGKLPVEFPSAENQLLYIFEFYKKTMKRVEVYKNLKSGKMTMDDYLKTED